MPSTPRRKRSTAASRRPAPSTAAAELLPLAEVLAELKVPRRTFYGWMQRGLAPKTIKYPNGKLFVRREDLNGWLADQEVNA